MRVGPLAVVGVSLALTISLAACSRSPSSSSTSAQATSAIVAAETTAGSQAAFPDAAAIANAASDDDNWFLPGKTLHNNRYTGLDQITPQNVNTLAKAWSTEIADNGQQESGLLIWQGTMYLSTPHDNVLAVDATTGKLKWQFSYNPAYSLVYTVNRGVGLADGKVFIATLDCRVVAVDANTGKQAWNVNGCPNDKYTSTANSLFSMASYVYDNQIILGTGGGDDGNIGHVMGFSVQDGHRLWDWQNIPGPGQPGHETWPGNSWQHGGGDTWGGLTVEPATKTLYIPVGNPGPDMVDTNRKGLNLYTNSVVAIDISGAKPRMRWYYKIVKDDTHDTDPAMPPILFDGKIGGTTRALLAIGDKGGDFVVLDRTNGKVVYRMAVDKQTGLLTTQPTRKGTFACPNHGGGVEWLGGSYDPSTNLFLLPSTQECAVWKVVSTDPKYIAGQPYTGGPLPRRQKSTGQVTAIDIATGQLAWVRPLPYSAQGGVVVTRSGVAFTSDLDNLYALDAKTGKVLWQTKTGASIIAPVSVYRAGGNEYVSVLSGSAGSQQTPNAPIAKTSVLTAYRLGPVSAPIANTTAGQKVIAGTSESNANAPPSIGSAPFTAAQAKAGATLYNQQCAACHGANLQGVSGPALTGTGFARSHLNLSQVRSIVTTQMPLGAPGSLKPDQYASIIAFLLVYDCVTPSQAGKEAFPTANEPAFSKVTFGGRSCPPKSGAK
ncbi:MAG: alcohol dehydrogenase [Candidatus Eremiobacteraeota bacterium]|nr:alcohol dehydrogenase [Candidatus Eremiobacteraeota bacterium]